MDWLLYFWTFLKAGLLSTGGRGPFPYLYTDMIEQGWATPADFPAALTVGEISPGPNGLWVICLGYLTDGLRGALLATLAISLPPMVVLAVAALHRRVGDHPAMQGFVRGLGLAVCGVFLIVVVRLLQENGLNVGSILIVLASIGLGMTGRVPVTVLLVLAGVVGALIY